MSGLQPRQPLRALFVFGTRPEAIKLAPVIAELRRRSTFSVRTCLTAQHRSLLDQVLKVFNLHRDYDLNIMKDGQSLFDITTKTLEGIAPILSREKPDIVFVQGDTTSAFAAALSAFYERIPVAHVEAGLRTFDLSAPFPEELNRRLIAPIARFNFAPTRASKRHLLAEHIAPRTILTTGNTVIDALRQVIRRPIPAQVRRLTPAGRFILVTAHRRESFGEPLRGVFKALRDIVRQYPDVMILYPVHPNPNVLGPARQILGREPRVRLLPPLEYVPFLHLLKRCYLVLSDSGGVQEEGPALGKPVLILRDKTERPEAVASGAARLVGTSPEKVFNEVSRLLDSKRAYRVMSRKTGVFGDGKASARIADFLEYHYDRRKLRPSEFHALG